MVSSFECVGVVNRAVDRVYVRVCIVDRSIVGRVDIVGWWCLDDWIVEIIVCVIVYVYKFEIILFVLVL